MPMLSEGIAGVWKQARRYDRDPVNNYDNVKNMRKRSSSAEQKRQYEAYSKTAQMC